MDKLAADRETLCKSKIAALELDNSRLQQTASKAVQGFFLRSEQFV